MTNQPDKMLALSMRCFLIWFFLVTGAVTSFAATPHSTRSEFFSQAAVPTLEIVLDETSVASLTRNSRQYVAGEVIEGDTRYPEVGIHLKGREGSFRSISQKPSFTLNFNKFRKGQMFHGIDKLHLNNSVQDGTYACESLGSELFRAAGLPAAHVSHCRVVLNERDLGLYVVVEGFDKGFLKEQFGDASGNLYEGGSPGDLHQQIEKKSGNGPDDKSDVRRLLNALQKTNSQARLQELAAVVDLEAFYKYLAMEVLTSHSDGYSLQRNNYSFYWNPSSERFVFLPHGMDQLFRDPHHSLMPDCGGIVAGALLYSAEGQKQYRETCRQLCAELFTTPRLTNSLETIQDKLRPVWEGIAPGLAAKHSQAITELRGRILARIQHLQVELGSPVTDLSETGTNTWKLGKPWIPAIDLGMAETGLTTNGTPTLYLRITGRYVPTVASWRKRVRLPPGRYRFEGRVKAEGIIPLSGIPNGGVNLRVYGEGEAGSKRSPATVTSGWDKLSCEFTVSDSSSAEKELVCELRGFKGSVSFEETSLAIERLSGVQNDPRESD